MELARWVLWISAVTFPSPFFSLPMLLSTDCPVILAIIITTVAETIKVAFYLLGFEALKKVLDRFGPRLVILKNPATPWALTRRVKVILKVLLRRLAKNKWGLILVAALPSVLLVNLGPFKIALILGSTQSITKTLIIFFLGDLLFICTYAAVLIGGEIIWASQIV